MKHALTAAAALLLGARQVARVWRYVVAAYAWNVALALSMAFLVQDAVRSSLGASLAGDRMKASWDSLWYASFSNHVDGVASTFRPSVSGAGAILDALDTFFDGFDGLFHGGLEASLWPVLVAYWLSWSFLSGGFVSLFVSPDSGEGFMARAARMFPRFLTITLAGLVGYALVLGWMRGGAHAFVASRLREVSDERVHFAWTLGEYIVVWTLVFALNLVVDYAKVFAARAAGARGARAVMREALARSPRFVSRHVVSITVLYVLTGLAGFVVMVLYLSIVPGALDSTSPAIVGTFLLGQAYVLSRIALRCLFYAGEACLAARLTDPSVATGRMGAA